MVVEVAIHQHIAKQEIDHRCSCTCLEGHQQVSFRLEPLFLMMPLGCVHIAIGSFVSMDPNFAVLQPVSAAASLLSRRCREQVSVLHLRELQVLRRVCIVQRDREVVGKLACCSDRFSPLDVTCPARAWWVLRGHITPGRGGRIKTS